MAFDQTLWAVMDPNWGEPVVIPETVRVGRMDAQRAFEENMDHSLYHGGSQFPYPDGTRGSLDAARKQGYKLVQLKFTQANVEIVG